MGKLGLIVLLLCVGKVLNASNIVSPRLFGVAKSALEKHPSLGDKTMLEWSFDTLAWEQIKEYEIYELEQTKWVKIGTKKTSDTLMFLINKSFVANKTYTYKIVAVFKDLTKYESQPIVYQYIPFKGKGVTEHTQEFVTLDGKQYFHVSWTIPEGFDTQGQDFVVLFEDFYTKGRYASYQNFVQKKENEEYFEIYPYMKGYTFSYYIMTTDYGTWVPSPVYSFTISKE